MNEFQIALLVVSSVWFIKYSHKVYIVSIKIMYHYHEVITTGETGKVSLGNLSNKREIEHNKGKLLHSLVVMVTY